MLFFAALGIWTRLVQASGEFVLRNGPALILADKPFRFGGANIYWLGLDENVGGVNFPTQFRIADALMTAAGMGVTVIRAHTLGVSTGNRLSFEPSLGVFNSSALDSADFAIYVAAQLQLKLIVPLTDNYAYYHGGYHDFTDWLALPKSEFYTSSAARSAFKNYITARLTHVNPYTGRAASDESAIMMWETGNELSNPSPPADWTAEMAALIKSLAPKQLVMDGNYGVALASLNCPNVDVVSDHFYPVDASRLAQGAAQAAAAGKVYGAFEYGWSSSAGDTVAEFLYAGFLNANVSGQVFWSLFPHADNHGFVQHNDGFTVHYPGDATLPSMVTFVPLAMAHAANMTGRATPSAAPQAPRITELEASSGASLNASWRGGAMAATYIVEVSASSSAGPWTLVCPTCVYTDNDTPIYIPTTTLPKNGWLRAQAVGLDGSRSPFSTPMQYKPPF